MVIFAPPEAPTTILIFFVLSTKMEGHMEDNGCLPVGDTDSTEAQFSACNLQTASSRCTSKPKVSISIFLTHLVFCSSPECPTVSYTHLLFAPIIQSLTLVFCTGGLKAPSSMVLFQLGLSVTQLPLQHHRTSLSVLSLPCLLPKHRYRKVVESQPTLAAVRWLCRKQ